MNYLIAADTDIGTTKDTNQDSLSIKIMQTNQGKMALAVLCDGMGGLDKGEVASASVIRAFDDWAKNRLAVLSCNPLSDYSIQSEWEEIIASQNQILREYGKRQGVALGTTVVILLLTESRYYLMNVGDSRAYEIDSSLVQLTQDQTFIEREVSQGRMTREEAENDPRRSVLLQCVGASDKVYPDMFFGDTKKNALYLLCSDGFRHELTPEEIFQYCNPQVLCDEKQMEQTARALIDLNKMRQERDNISVALVRTF